MSTNNPNDPANTSTGGGTYGGADTGGGSTGLARGAGNEGEGYGGQTYGSGGGAAAGTATGLAAQAKEYGQKVADAATTAKGYITDKASVVGDKIQDLRNKDYQQVAEEAKDYARQNPGQALLISAAAGFVLGLLLRGSRR